MMKITVRMFCAGLDFFRKEVQPMKAMVIHEMFEYTYGQEGIAKIGTLCDLVAKPMSFDEARNHPDALAQVEAIFSGWGYRQMDASFLDLCPNLKIVFYAGGTIHRLVSDAFWERGIRICSAWRANAVPVSEFALSQILFTLKRGYYGIRRYLQDREIDPSFDLMTQTIPGAYESTVGLVSLGAIGARVAELLKAFDVQVLAYDPYVSEERAKALGVTLCPLEELFARSNVVSLHAPWLPETEGMITGKLIASMKPYAALINTSRGAVVNEPEMIEVLTRRPDLQAMLDVTHPEPPAPDSPLFTLQNVVLTPHIAGSFGHEVRRHARYMFEECRRYQRGEPLLHEITKEMAERMA